MMMKNLPETALYMTQPGRIVQIHLMAKDDLTELNRESLDPKKLDKAIYTFINSDGKLLRKTIKCNNFSITMTEAKKWKIPKKFEFCYKNPNSQTQHRLKKSEFKYYFVVALNDPHHQTPILETVKIQKEIKLHEDIGTVDEGSLEQNEDQENRLKDPPVTETLMPPEADEQGRFFHHHVFPNTLEEDRDKILSVNSHKRLSIPNSMEPTPMFEEVPSRVGSANETLIVEDSEASDNETYFGNIFETPNTLKSKILSASTPSADRIFNDGKWTHGTPQGRSLKRLFDMVDEANETNANSEFNNSNSIFENPASSSNTKGRKKKRFSANRVESSPLNPITKMSDMIFKVFSPK